MDKVGIMADILELNHEMRWDAHLLSCGQCRHAEYHWNMCEEGQRLQGLYNTEFRRKNFPILTDSTERQSWAKTKGGWPSYFPWELLKPHEKQAVQNHSQSLHRLSERGGLSPRELWLVMHDKGLREIREVEEEQAVEWLRTIEGVEWRT